MTFVEEAAALVATNQQQKAYITELETKLGEVMLQQAKNHPTIIAEQMKGTKNSLNCMHSDVQEILAVIKQMLPLLTNNQQDVNEPPSSIPLWIEMDDLYNQAELRQVKNALIANGGLSLIVEAGTIQYRGVLTVDNMHGTTVLTRIP